MKSIELSGNGIFSPSPHINLILSLFTKLFSLKVSLSIIKFLSIIFTETSGYFFKILFAISPVPPAKSKIFIFFLLSMSIRLTKSFFHILCKPKDIMSFIRSYSFATLSKTF